MNPKLSEAYECSRCHKVYPETPYGKEQATRCCSCRQCGTQHEIAYIGGTNTLCCKCSKREHLEDAIKRKADIDSYFTETLKEAAEVGLTVEVTESGSVKVVDVEKVPIAKG